MRKIFINSFFTLVFCAFIFLLTTHLASAEELMLSDNSFNLPIGSLKAIIINGSGDYVINNNSSSTVASASIIYDNILNIKALTPGSTEIEICQTDKQCAVTSVTVIAPIVKENKNAPKTKYKFSKHLKIGSTGKEVEELQKRLQAERLYVGKIHGKFDANTRTALKKYQKIKKISPVGVLGPITRASLNK